MIITEIKDFSQTLYETSREYFLSLKRDDLLMKSQISLVWWYLVAKQFETLWILHFSPIVWKYHYHDYYVSTAHNANKVMIALSDQKITVDCELIKPRDPSLLTTKISSWNDFYIQWCGKECVVKYLNLPFSEVENCLYHTITPTTVEVSYHDSSFQIPYKIEQGYCFALLW